MFEIFRKEFIKRLTHHEMTEFINFVDVLVEEYKDIYLVMDKVSFVCAGHLFGVFYRDMKDMDLGKDNYKKDVYLIQLLNDKDIQELIRQEVMQVGLHL